MTQVGCNTVPCSCGLAPGQPAPAKKVEHCPVHRTALGSYLEAQARLTDPAAVPVDERLKRITAIVADQELTIATLRGAISDLRREGAMATDLLGRKQDEIARLRGEVFRTLGELQAAIEKLEYAQHERKVAVATFDEPMGGRCG